MNGTGRQASLPAMQSTSPTNTEGLSEDALRVWKALKTPVQRTLPEMIRASHCMGEPTPDLLKALISIATKLAQHPNFMYYENLDDMRNEAIIQMIKFWTKCDLNRCISERTVFAYFYQVALNTFQHFMAAERRHRNIQADLFERAKDGTLEFSYRP